MEDQEIIDQAVRQRDSGGEMLWSANLQWNVMRDCGECADRVKRLQTAVMGTPLPTFTLRQLVKMQNEKEIWGFSYDSFDKFVMVQYSEHLGVRGILIEEDE